MYKPGNFTVLLFFGGMVPTSSQFAILDYQNITFDSLILILCNSSNITCNNSFVTFDNSLFFFFLTFDGFILTLCSSNITCDSFFLIFGGFFTFFFLKIGSASCRERV